METCNQSSTDAGENSETKPPRQLSTNPKAIYMRDYLRKQRISKRFGWTVSQWEAAGSPIPSGSGEGIAAQKESPDGPPDAA